MDSSAIMTEIPDYDQELFSMERLKKYLNIAIKRFNPVINSHNSIKNFMKNVLQIQRQYEIRRTWTHHFRLKLALHLYCLFLHASLYIIDYSKVTRILLLDLTYIMVMNDEFRFINLIYMGLYAVAIYSDFLFYLNNSQGTLDHFQLLNQVYYENEQQWTGWNPHLKINIFKKRSCRSVKRFLDGVLFFLSLITEFSLVAMSFTLWQNRTEYLTEKSILNTFLAIGFIIFGTLFCRIRLHSLLFHFANVIISIILFSNMVFSFLSSVNRILLHYSRKINCTSSCHKINTKKILQLFISTHQACCAEVSRYNLVIGRVYTGYCIMVLPISSIILVQLWANNDDDSYKIMMYMFYAVTIVVMFSAQLLFSHYSAILHQPYLPFLHLHDYSVKFNNNHSLHIKSLTYGSTILGTDWKLGITFDRYIMTMTHHGLLQCIFLYVQMILITQTLLTNRL